MGIASIWGFALVGIDAVPVRVEAHARSGLPGVTIVGLPGAAVREARERVRSGAASSGVPLPTRRITINLSPGDVPKEGPGFDLPMALATLAACDQVPARSIQGLGAVGEMSLDGFLRPTRGILSVAESAGRIGVDLLIAPLECLPAVSAVGDLPVVGVRSLAEALAAILRPEYRSRAVERGRRWLRMRRSVAGPTQRREPDLAEVVGHEQAKRALEVVAAGGHHLLMVGSPGAGKTMLARRLPSILPPLTATEALDVTRVWSAYGHSGQTGLITHRPFRAPHHTASRAALIGGGMTLRPGEVSLAHHGVLFLDELPEFSRDALEALREPLEDGCVSISRRTGTSVFPAACTLVGAMNPCPCGYLGHEQRSCRCTAAVIDRYQSRLSGPLLDRVDCLIEVPPMTLFSLENGRPGESSAVVRERVLAARSFGAARLSSQSGGAADGGTQTGGGSDASAIRVPQSLEACLRLTSEARSLLRQALVKEGLSGRAYTRVIRLARTIADLDQIDVVGIDHVAEALVLRLDYRRVGLR
ncbi:MAG: YifB family Mg chelatase-like AAA ATPase [Thermoleophilia bacterium]|jgi:magnesium chelatase family protein